METIKNVSISELHSFRNHPFKVENKIYEEIYNIEDMITDCEKKKEAAHQEGCGHNIGPDMISFRRDYVFLRR